MFIEKQDILSALQEKMHTKLENLRQELAESIFSAELSEGVFFVYDKKERDIVGGPFASKDKANAFVNDMEDKAQLEVVDEKKAEKLMGA